MKFIASPFKMLALVVCLTLMGGVAVAGTLTVNVYVSIAPDPFGSAATFNSWSANALAALQAGSSTGGTVGQPDYYAQVASFQATDMIGSSTYNYWRGQVSPPAPYDTQTGNMLMFPMAVYGNGTQFTMGDVSFTDSFFGTTFPPPNPKPLSGVGFGVRMIGINFGADGVLGGGDDTIYGGTSPTPGGPASLLDALFFSGFGDQFFIPDLAGLQTGIDQIQAASTPYATGTYFAGAVSGTAGVEMVPEPATLSFGVIGVLLIGLGARRKNRV